MSGAAANLTVGREMTSRPYPLDDAAAKAYNASIETPARRTPRVNIHNDGDAARKAGFRAPIAAGEQTYALMANFLVELFGLAFLRGGRMEAALIKPVFYGDKLTMRARVVGESRSAVDLEIWAENHRAERVLAGSARVPVIA